WGTSAKFMIGHKCGNTKGGTGPVGPREGLGISKYTRSSNCSRILIDDLPLPFLFSICFGRLDVHFADTDPSEVRKVLCFCFFHSLSCIWTEKLAKPVT